MSFRENGEALQGMNVAFFTASCDSVETNTEFAKELELNYPILSDPEGTAATAYGVYNPDRKFSGRKTFVIGKDAKILHIFDQVNVRNHGADVAAKLKDLGVGE